MFSLEVLIMVSAIVFCLGGLLGAIISRSIFPPEQQKQLEENLNNSRKELDQYQRDVAQHFAETAQLVNNLTQSYKSVHDHLATGALQLTNAEITQSMLSAGDESLGLDTPEQLEEQHIEPPRDWAPKPAGQTGTLSEEYGLEQFENEIPKATSVRTS
ncbi:YhcB family protein [Agaribacterium sp. ZY112]|uniref:YhcB family protein n=1 Tax=Agaribacterium sp. ZY112 TaxID=3233574 RepID=UPI00352405BE